MDSLLAAILAATLLVLALLLFGRLLALAIARRREAAEAGHARRAAPGSGACPLCSSTLAPGERVKSDIYPGKGDRIMRIFGCPRCLPPLGRAARLCPVCGASLPPDGWAVARYFERPGRRHVHVLGCTICHPAAGGSSRR